jgi:hypothetical protein
LAPVDRKIAGAAFAVLTVTQSGHRTYSGTRGIAFLIHNSIFVEDEKKAIIGGEIAKNVYVSYPEQPTHFEL